MSDDQVEENASADTSHSTFSDYTEDVNLDDKIQKFEKTESQIRPEEPASIPASKRRKQNKPRKASPLPEELPSWIPEKEDSPVREITFTPAPCCGPVPVPLLNPLLLPSNFNGSPTYLDDSDRSSRSLSMESGPSVGPYEARLMLMTGLGGFGLIDDPVNQLLGHGHYMRTRRPEVSALIAERRQRETEAQRQRRRNQSEEQRRAARARQIEIQRDRRASETEEQRRARNARAAETQRRRRQNQSEEQRRLRAERHNEAQRVRRLTQKQNSSFSDIIAPSL